MSPPPTSWIAIGAEDVNPNSSWLNKLTVFSYRTKLGEWRILVGVFTKTIDRVAMKSGQGRYLATFYFTGSPNSVPSNWSSFAYEDSSTSSYARLCQPSWGKELHPSEHCQWRELLQQRSGSGCYWALSCLLCNQDTWCHHGYDFCTGLLPHLRYLALSLTAEPSPAPVETMKTDH